MWPCGMRIAFYLVNRARTRPRARFPRSYSINIVRAQSATVQCSAHIPMGTAKCPLARALERIETEMVSTDQSCELDKSTWTHDSYVCVCARGMVKWREKCAHSSYADRVRALVPGQTVRTLRASCDTKYVTRSRRTGRLLMELYYYASRAQGTEVFFWWGLDRLYRILYLVRAHMQK